LGDFLSVNKPPYFVDFDKSYSTSLDINNKKAAISSGFMDFIGLFWIWSWDEGDSIEQLSTLNHYISF
jgi:hypothetical protein